MHRAQTVITLLVLLPGLLALPSAATGVEASVAPGIEVAQAQQETPRAGETTQEGAERGYLHERVVREGIAIDVEMEPIGSGATDLREGDPVKVRFEIRDNRGEPLTSLYPAAWMDRLPVVGAPEARDPMDCQEKVEAFVGGSLLAQPEVDLNVYYVLAMNDDATISVVDPLFGFGGSKLLEMIFLKSPGMDWELTADQRRLFVSMPESDQVAVVDTADWQVLTNIDVGPAPARMVLQPDEKYLWVAWQGAEGEPSGISVVDTDHLREVGRVTTGRGAHDLVLGDDNRHLFATNHDDGTVSIVDVETFETVRTLDTGGEPTSLAFSEIGQAVYVAHRKEGHITAIDTETLEVVGEAQAEPGIEKIRFAPGGRYGFVVNPPADALHILDAASHRVVQTGDMEDEPFDVAFSDELGYVVHRKSEIVLMVPLKQIGREGEAVPVIDFPGGQHPPGRAAKPSLAETVVQAPGATAVLVSNPTDKAIFYYKEGMAAPMGHFKNYGREPRAVEVIDRSFQENEPGVYETAVKVRRPGRYHLAVFVDSPRVVDCFSFSVGASALRAADRREKPVDIEYLVEEAHVPVGRETLLDLKVVDRVSGAAKMDLEDVQVLTFLAPGIWQKRHRAEPQGDGIYRIRFTPPRPGVYYVFTEIGSQDLGLNESASIILTAEPARDGVEIAEETSNLPDDKPKEEQP